MGKKGKKKAKEFAWRGCGDNEPLTDFMRQAVEDAFYEGYMSAKEEKFHGKISII